MTVSEWVKSQESGSSHLMCFTASDTQTMEVRTRINGQQYNFTFPPPVPRHNRKQFRRLAINRTIIALNDFGGVKLAMLGLERDSE